MRVRARARDGRAKKRVIASKRSLTCKRTWTTDERFEKEREKEREKEGNKEREKEGNKEREKERERKTE